MKFYKNLEYIEDWKKIARIDWQRVKRNLRDKDAVGAGFYLQQCLEKFLKAFLLTYGWHLKKIHRLDVLLEEALHYNEDLKAFCELCERVSGYYRADRYPPLMTTELTCEDIEKDMPLAERFIKTMFLEEKLND